MLILDSGGKGGSREPNCNNNHPGRRWGARLRQLMGAVRSGRAWEQGDETASEVLGGSACEQTEGARPIPSFGLNSRKVRLLCAGHAAFSVQVFQLP